MLDKPYLSSSMAVTTKEISKKKKDEPRSDRDVIIQKGAENTIDRIHEQRENSKENEN